MSRVVESRALGRCEAVTLVLSHSYLSDRPNAQASWSHFQVAGVKAQRSRSRTHVWAVAQEDGFSGLKTAAVTGGASGIGRAVAQRLRDRRSEHLVPLTTDFGG
jgi:hypothetical protein